MRLATLLEIGRTLSTATDPAVLCHSVASRLSVALGSDLLFCAETDAAGASRVVLFADAGDTRDADATYAAVTDAATPDTGILLDATGARALGIGGDRAADARAALVMPIRAGEHALGEIGAIRFSDSEPFDEVDAELLGFASAILAALLGERRRGEENETRRREAERLEQIGRAITASLDLSEVLERIMQAALDLTEADLCTVWQRDHDTARILASRGTNALAAGFEVQVAPEIAAALMTRRESIRIDDVATDPRLPDDARSQLAGEEPRSAILVPMICDDTVVGVLSVGHHDMRRPDGETIRILERLALQAAIALENARLHAEIHSLSLTDPLTGLPNRRHMEMVLRKEFEAARRGRPLTVVLFDLDDFKGYNDRHGHAAGDEALRAFARILLSETRAMNLSVRYGGDEFLTILSESTAEGARHLVARIEERVRESGEMHPIGVSAGIAQHDDAMSTPEDLVHAADVAMYARKEAPLSEGESRDDSTAGPGGEPIPVP